MTDTLVLGLGNPLMGDDGVGLALLARVREALDLALDPDPRPDPDLDWLDGGTNGLALLPAVESARRLLVLDAVRSGSPPGTARAMSGDEFRVAPGPALSPHQLDLQEVLSLARWRDRAPEVVTVVGVEPAGTEFGAGLSPDVEAALDAATSLALDQLEDWGHRLEPAHGRRD